MTPEERAERLADDLDHTVRMGGIVTRDYLAERLSAAFREAVTQSRSEERLECYRFLRDRADRFESNGGIDYINAAHELRRAADDMERTIARGEKP